MPYNLPPDTTIEQVAARIAQLCPPTSISRIVIEVAEGAIKLLDLDKVRECAALGYCPEQNSWLFDSIFTDEAKPLEARVALLELVVKSWGGLLPTERLALGLVGYDVVELVAAAREAGLDIPPDVKNVMIARALNQYSGSPLKGAELVLKMLGAGFVVEEGIVRRAINTYFSHYHRRWKISAESRRKYVEFINALIENDSVVLGPESIPNLKRLSGLSLLSRKAKSKIQAVAVAAELIGIEKD